MMRIQAERQTAVNELWIWMDTFYSDLCHPSILKASASVWAQITVISAMLWIFSHGHRALSSPPTVVVIATSASLYHHLCHMTLITCSATTMTSRQHNFLSKNCFFPKHPGPGHIMEHIETHQWRLTIVLVSRMTNDGSRQITIYDCLKQCLQWNLLNTLRTRLDSGAMKWYVWL